MSINFVFLLLQFLDTMHSYIIIKFKRFSPINTESKNMGLEDFITQRLYNIYTTNIHLGEPPQIIPGFLKCHEYKFFLSNNYCPKKEYYYKEKSNTFLYENSNNYYNRIKILESLLFNSTNNNIKIENFTLIVDNDLKSPQCIHIGTQLLMKSDEKDTNLIDILHKKKNIQSYFYKFKIINEDELYLILDLNIDINNNNYTFIKPIIFKFFPKSQTYQKWGLVFESFRFNNYSFLYDDYIKAEFDINYGCFLATSDFKKNFEKFLKDNGINMEEQYSDKENYIYFFDKSMNVNEIEKIKNIELVFYNRDLNFNFTFNFNDLFLEKNNGFYFLIVFDYKTREEWKFGFPFFKKYNFVFNHDSKIMGFNHLDDNLDNEIIKNINNKNNYGNKELNNSNDNKVNLKIVLIIIFGIILFISIILFFGILIGKKLFTVRKTKVNELLELYDYTSKDAEKQNK